MDQDSSRASLARLLADVKTIAIVGLSADAERPSNQVARFLVERAYDCVGVNPAIAGRSVHGVPVVARLDEIAHPIDMVDIFRASRAVAGIVEEVLALDPLPRVIWMQLGVRDAAAKARAEAAGVRVVMDHCPKIVLGAG